MDLTPKDQESERIKVYNLLAAANVGDIISHEELDQALGRDFRADRGPYYSAKKTLEKNDHRSTEPVLGKGYRVISGAAMMNRAHTERVGKIATQAHLGTVTTKSVDQNELTQTELAQHARQEGFFGDLRSRARHAKAERKRIEPGKPRESDLTPYTD
jgi:hypothetical protein